MAENRVQHDHDLAELLPCKDNSYGDVSVNMEKPMDSTVFAPLLQASISQWREKGKKGIWIKLPIEHSNLVDVAVKQGFRYHHAEPDYLMLVFWIPETTDTLPANASHRVGIGAFVMNSQREVLVVQENSGKLKGTSVWKFPTGGVDEGEDICTAAIREVKEETGIETEFVEVLAFRYENFLQVSNLICVSRQSHKSFYSKSDLFFVCMLRPHSFDIKKQNIEIEAAKWMPIKDYAAQPFIRGNDMFNYIAKICIAKSEEGKDYAGFSPLSSKTTSGKTSYLYFNGDLKNQLSSDNQKQKMPM